MPREDAPAALLPPLTRADTPGKSIRQLRPSAPLPRRYASILEKASPRPAWIRRFAFLSIGVVDLLIRTSFFPL